MAFNIIERPDMITSIVGTALDPVGREDSSKSLTSVNYDESLFSKDYAKNFSSEEYDETITCTSRAHKVIYLFRLRVLRHHKSSLLPPVRSTRSSGHWAATGAMETERGCRIPRG